MARLHKTFIKMVLQFAAVNLLNMLLIVNKVIFFLYSCLLPTMAHYCIYLFTHLFLMHTKHKVDRCWLITKRRTNEKKETELYIKNIQESCMNYIEK